MLYHSLPYRTILYHIVILYHRISINYISYQYVTYIYTYTSYYMLQIHMCISNIDILIITYACMHICPCMYLYTWLIMHICVYVYLTYLRLNLRTIRISARHPLHLHMYIPIRTVWSIMISSCAIHVYYKIYKYDTFRTVLNGSGENGRTV